MLAKGLRVLARAAREEPGVFTLAICGAAVTGVVTVAGAYLVGAVVGHVVVPALTRGELDSGAVALGAAALVAVSLVKVVGVFSRRLGAGFTQYRLQASYRNRVARRYLELPLAWHHRHQTGTLLSIVSSDVDAIWNPILTLPLALGTVVMLVTAIVSMVVVDWPLALVGLAVLPVLYGLYVAYSREMAPRVARAQRLRGDVSAIAHESVDGALVVKAMGREAHETARFVAKLAELRDALISVGRVRGLFEPTLDSLPSLGTLAVLLVGAWRLRQGAIDVSELIGVAFLITLFDMPVRAVGWVLADLPRTVVGWERVQGVLTATGAMAYGAGRLAAGAVELRFDRVTFGYRPDRPVVHGMSFRVPPGSLVALVGATGSGKSTIAALAARGVDPDQGAVTLGGHDLRELTAGSVAGAVGLVPQVPFLFDDTVRANVALDRTGIDDAAVWAALRTAQADGFVAGLPDGLDAVVGERGATLSGGQRQRLTLARALAGRPGLLVLDDATSAVDPSVEAAILSGLGRPATMLVIAHRRATVALADAVVFLGRGRIVATGTHDQLMSTVPSYVELMVAYERREAR